MVEPTVPGEIQSMEWVRTPLDLSLDLVAMDPGEGGESQGGERGGRQESYDSHDGPPHLRVTVAVSRPDFWE